jgi:hypothetical protein
MIRNLVSFYGEELLAPRPTPKLEDLPLSAARDCLFKVFAATLLICRPFLHPQPEDAACRGERDRLVMESLYIKSNNYDIKSTSVKLPLNFVFFKELSSTAY